MHVKFYTAHGVDAQFEESSGQSTTWNDRRNVRVVRMNSVQHHYMRINKYLMCTIGQWPYQGLLEKIFIEIVFVPIIAAQIILQGGGMITALNHSDMEAFMEDFTPFIISWMCVFKFVNYIYNHAQLKNLLDVMQEDWRTYSKSEVEYEILCKSYAVGKKVTISYAVSLYGSMTPFMAVPTVINVADSLGFYNASDTRPLMFRLEYLIDVEKYYYPLLIHSYVGTLEFITIVVAIDSMMVFYVQHECGLCEILGKWLETFSNADNANVELHPSYCEDEAYQNAKNCVILHNHIIHFAKQIEEANTMSFFFQLGLNMIGISFTMYQAVLNIEKPRESFRHASFTMCLLSVVLLESWPGEQLTNHTNNIFEYTTSGKWYLSSMRCRKTLHIMLMRSFVPIRLTAGRLYALNLENFSSVLRTSFSYFTVLCSLQ